MQGRRDQDAAQALSHPLKALTAEQFMALGGGAVAYVRPITGDKLSALIDQVAELESQELYQLVMSADGTALMVADSTEAVSEWLAERGVGVVSLH